MISVTDAGRFKVLKESVDAGLADRRDWFARARKNRELRYMRVNTKKPLYVGAPNIADPVIADMIRDLKQSIMTTLWQAPRLAQFVGLDSLGVKYADAAEAAFDFHLRRIPRTRARMAQCVDDVLTYGHGLAKAVDRLGRNGLKVADFVPASPLSVVVPTSTGEIGASERICHMMRFTVPRFEAAAKAKGWNPDVVRKAVSQAVKGRADGSADRGGVSARFRDGALSDSGLGVDVWEIFYDTELGRRVCMICPDFPERPLVDSPWVWLAVVGQETVVPDRPWPFVQAKNEDVTGFYASMGVPEILEDDQKEASCYRTVRGVALDFAGKPFVKGPRVGSQFRFRAGENIGNQEIVWYDAPVDKQVYQQEYARNLAMKRVGSAQGFMGSLTGGDQRKTATEIHALMSTVNGMAVDAVDRFAEPWAELFGMMWEGMAREARRNGGLSGMTLSAGKALDPEVWCADFAISMGVSGRSVAQQKTLAALTNVGQLAPVLENMTQTLGPASVKEFYFWIFQTLDGELARKVMAVEAAGGHDALGAD